MTTKDAKQDRGHGSSVKTTANMCEALASISSATYMQSRGTHMLLQHSGDRGRMNGASRSLLPP